MSDRTRNAGLQTAIASRPGTRAHAGLRRSPAIGATGPPRGALVLGADYRALGVVRSLGRHGVPVWMLAEPAEPLASASRYVRRSLRWPSADDDERAAFLRELAIANGLDGWALIPSADSTAAIVARNHEELAEHYTHTTPAWNVIKWAHDKRLTYDLAARVNVPCPRTMLPGAELDAATIGLSFPVVVKPAIKERANALATAKAWRADDRQQLEHRYADACAITDPDILMVQELIPGGGESQFSYAALCRDGTPLVAVTARRTRQYPAELGRASTFVETVEFPEVVEPSLRLLHDLRYTGLIEIEYKRDPRDGVLKLLDMNPRVWGWHTLCGKAGVDFPWLLWLLVSGESLPPTTSRAGVRWLRFSTDMPTACHELLRRRLSPREYARSLRWPRERAIFAWDDPLPGLIEIPILVYVAAHRLLQREPV